MTVLFQKELPTHIRCVSSGTGLISLKGCLEREAAAYAAGRADYADKDALRQEAVLGQYKALLKRLEHAYTQLEETLKEQLPEILELLVKRVWGEAALGPEALKANIDEVLGALGELPQTLSLRLCPGDKALLEASQLPLSYPRLQLEGDPSLAPGDLFFETPLGLIDARIATKLHAALAVL